MNAQPDWIANLHQAIKADPKKTGVLGILFALMLAMMGRQFLTGGKNLPASAPAAAVGTADAGSGIIPVPAAQAGNVARVGNISPSLQKWLDAPAVPPVSRNLFNVNIEYFPLDGSRTSQFGANDDIFWSRLAKSMDVRTDERQRHDNMVASFIVDAQKLQLQSTVMGPQPRAMIDGQMVGEQSVVAGFRVLKIEARKVIVEREGIMLAIQMK